MKNLSCVWRSSQSFPSSAAKHQGGVVLIEAMIAILIFSIGILALVGLQAVAVKNTFDAQIRSEAAFLASEIVSTMWADNADVSSYGAASSAERVVAWRSKVSSRLPGVTATANVPTITVSGTEVTVTIFWQQPGDATVRNHTLVTQVVRAV